VAGDLLRGEEGRGEALGRGESRGGVEGGPVIGWVGEGASHPLTCCERLVPPPQVGACRC
jgi:hypothetical protein